MDTGERHTLLKRLNSWTDNNMAELGSWIVGLFLVNAALFGGPPPEEELTLNWKIRLGIVGALSLYCGWIQTKARTGIALPSWFSACAFLGTFYLVLGLFTLAHAGIGIGTLSSLMLAVGFLGANLLWTLKHAIRAIQARMA